jgi:hypothetical protein
MNALNNYSWTNFSQYSPQPQAGTLRYTGDSDQALSAVYNAQRADYDANYRPFNKQTIASIGNGELLAAARENAQIDFAKGRGIADRMASRYGVNIDKVTARERNVRESHEQGINSAHTINTARFAQYERDVNLRDEMINIGRGITKDTISNLSSSADSEQQVKTANKAASANAKAQRTQLAATAALAILF